jgi:hypothetical protein
MPFLCSRKGNNKFGFAKNAHFHFILEQFWQKSEVLVNVKKVSLRKLLTFSLMVLGKCQFAPHSPPRFIPNPVTLLLVVKLIANVTVSLSFWGNPWKNVE